jgi:glycosyltransferase involved in cell wall biosynthesis
MDTRTLPAVTFIVPTLNALQHLPRLIASIKKQVYPKRLVEVIISDGGSTDGTKEYSRKNRLTLIDNPEIVHELGKTRAAEIARGRILFYTDSDNVLVQRNWIRDMVRPFLENPGIAGALPQTVPPPDSHPLNRYLGNLFTDPFTWYVYGDAANPRYYEKIFRPLLKTDAYTVYRFDPYNPPLFGLSQGSGSVSSVKRLGSAKTDDLVAGMEIMKRGLVAYVPGAAVYHYHISGWRSFADKYTKRIRANLYRTYPGMGYQDRKHSLSATRRLRAYLFFAYSLSMVFLCMDTLELTLRHRDRTMLLHIPATLLLAGIIAKEFIRFHVKKAIGPVRQFRSIHQFRVHS